MGSSALAKFMKTAKFSPTEVDRVTAIPAFEGFSEEERDAVRDVFPGETIELRDVQCNALLSLVQDGGLFGPIGVGHGKTIITLLAGKVLGNKRNMILVPPEVCNQLVQRDIPMLEKEFGLDFNYISIYQMGKEERSQVDFSKYETIVFPYSLLSVVDTYDLLDAVSPDIVCADECHLLRNKDSARTKRLMAYLHAREEIIFVPLSGTITKRSIFDYRHLIDRALGTGSPLPNSYVILKEWNSFLGVRQTAIDERNQVLGPNDIRSFRPLRIWYMKQFGGSVRHSRKEYRNVFSTRMRTTPGVVMTDGQSVDASLQIHNGWAKDNYGLPAIVDSYMEAAEKSWATPNGDELEDAMKLAALQSQLCSGFYYRLEWPDNTPQWVLDQHEAHNDLKKEMRKWMKRGLRKGCDTPLLVYRALKAEDAQVRYLQPFYKDWQELIEGEIPDRIQSVEWLSGYKIDMAKDWLSQNDGIVWYIWNATGEELARNIPNASYCPAGADISALQEPKVIASINAHHIGKNLQCHYKQLALEVHRTGSTWEQMLGRTHRQGQLEDTVYVDVACGTEFEMTKLGLAFLDAKYIQETGGGMQKLMLADFQRPYSEEQLRDKISKNPIFAA